MPQMHCNFFSYSLGHGVDLTITLPGVSPCDMDDPALLTHQMPEKFPVLYLLHGHGHDYLSWERFTFTCIPSTDKITMNLSEKRFRNS